MKIIRELRDELEKLRSEVRNGGGSNSAEVELYRQKLQETESLYKEMNQTWEERLATTQRILDERNRVGFPLPSFSSPRLFFLNFISVYLSLTHAPPFPLPLSPFSTTRNHPALSPSFFRAVT